MRETTAVTIESNPSAAPNLPAGSDIRRLYQAFKNGPELVPGALA